jgi:ssDNA-binding Zn-finger/Zn-ribbon topoisomerase 1
MRGFNSRPGLNNGTHIAKALRCLFLYNIHMKSRRWNEQDMISAIKQSRSYRQVLLMLKLKPAGGNYVQVKKYISMNDISISHFTHQGWNKGITTGERPRIALSDILVLNSGYQSYKLRNRLFRSGLKNPKCEECGWSKKSEDGRTPVELDHINGNSRDNRIENLRILCPNCHSLKPTHRGRNIQKKSGW